MIFIFYKLPSILYGTTHIRQLFQNLISNVIKCIDKPRGEIIIDCNDAIDYWSFSVTFKGLGIEQKHFNNIFKYSRTLSSGDSHIPDHKELTDMFKANDKNVLKVLKPVVMEEIVPHNDGLHTYISIKFPLYDSIRVPYGVCGISTDITDRKRSEKDILAIEERERQRIGRDLHDSLGQLLTGIAFKADILHYSLKEKNIDEAEQASDIETLVNCAINETRVLAKEASVLDDDESFLEAFNELASKVENIHGIVCSFNCEKNFRLGDFSKAMHLYRIAQEAVNNSIKHSNAKKIDINLFSKNGRTFLTVKDNGRGIRKLPQKSNGIGLRTMNYRASVIGASFKVMQDLNGGTVVTCSVGKK